MDFDFEEPFWTLSALIGIILTGIASVAIMMVMGPTWGIAGGWLFGFMTWGGMYLFFTKKLRS